MYLIKRFINTLFYSVLDFQPVNLDQIQEFVDKGKLTPKANGLITIRDLVNAGILTNPRDGVTLLAKVNLHYRFT